MTYICQMTAIFSLSPIYFLTVYLNMLTVVKDAFMFLVILIFQVLTTTENGVPVFNNMYNRALHTALENDLKQSEVKLNFLLFNE